MRRARAVLAVLLAGVIGVAGAADENIEDAELESVRDRVLQVVPDIRREDVRRAPAPGLFEVQHGMAFAYATADGKYLLRGDLIDLESGVVLTELSRRAARARSLHKLGETAVAFNPPDGPIRHTIFIYADVDCRYCRALHREVPRLNEKGVAVRYLFYPRKGERSPSFKQAQSVYCASDPRVALDTLFRGKALKDARTDCDNPVAQHLAMALALGVKGTPMVILPGGRVLYGQVGADALVEMLDKPEVAEPEAAARP